MSFPDGFLGAYKILAPIGRGGMGEVYRARDLKLDRQVAIKVLPADSARDDAARERLRREASAAAALDHPFICKIFEFHDDGEAAFIVMEYVAGETLHEWLRRGPIPQAEALRIALEIAEALDCAHGHSFLHRDLKPANIMLTQGHVKVMDFGLAKRFEHETGSGTRTAPLTAPGHAAGTPDYMSPEQITGLPLDPRSDIFAFAIILCELLGNPHPFRRLSMMDTVASILRDPPNLSSSLPQGFMLLIRRALAKDRAERYPSFQDLRTDLLRLASASAPVLADPALPLVGRDAEFSELTRALDAAMSGRGRVIVIGGEPGIGKTHLSAALIEEARRRGAFAVRGHCYELEGSLPYVPFIEMLEYCARTVPPESFRLSLGDDAPEVARLMPELRTLYPDIPPAIQLPPEQQRRFLFNAYRSFVERSARTTPIVAVFEDMHWADEPTLLLLEHVAQCAANAPILVVCTYRDVELDTSRPFARTLETLLRQKLAERISLRRFSLSGVENLLVALARQAPPSSLVRTLFAETEGNPFFIEEVFRHLAEEGLLFDEKGAWRAGLRGGTLSVPEGVRLVIGRRLDRLGSDARRILTAAAVIGRSFSLALLEELEGKNADTVLDAIEEAERAQLIAAERDSRDTRYRFIHELVRQTLACTLSLPRRQRLHARIATAIESVYANSLPQHVSALAHHLYSAGAAAAPEKTTTYLVLAAERATEAAAHEEALTHLENALSCWESDAPERIADLTARRAQTLRSLGRSTEAIDCYYAAIELLERSGNSIQAAKECLDLAAEHNWQVNSDAALAAADRGLALLDETPSQLRSMLLLTRIHTICNSGDVVRAFNLLAEVERAIDAADGDSNIWREFPLLHAMEWQGFAASAPRAADFHRRAGDLWVAAELDSLGYFSFFFSRPPASHFPADAFQREAERLGHHNAAWNCISYRAIWQLSQGDLQAAATTAAAAWELGEQVRNGWNFSIEFVRSCLAADVGDFPSAYHWAGRHPITRSWLAGINAAQNFAVRAESGDPTAAELWRTRQWPLPIAGQRNSAGKWMSLERAAVGLAFLGDRESLAALRAQTESLVETGIWTGFSIQPFRSAAALAAAAAGDWPAAEHHHRSAIQQTDDAPYRNSQPIAREWYALHLLERGETAKARELLSEALAMYEKLGMPFRARRVATRLI